MVTIVMGLDQHRAQITAEWLDTETGEVSRARVTPAHRDGVRRFLERFRGQRARGGAGGDDGLAVRRRGAARGRRRRCIWPSRPRRRRGAGNKKRAKTDRADARHLRELLMIGRLPESWIPPDHMLDLRARVRLRHTLVDQRGEWQQRIQAVLYHHGCPQRRDADDRRERAVAGRAARCRRRAREQVTVALAMIDALDAQIGAARHASCAPTRAASPAAGR